MQSSYKVQAELVPGFPRLPPPSFTQHPGSLSTSSESFSCYFSYLSAVSRPGDLTQPRIWGRNKTDIFTNISISRGERDWSVMSSYFIQEYQEDLEDEDEDSEVELVVQVLSWNILENFLILLWRQGRTIAVSERLLCQHSLYFRKNHFKINFLTLKNVFQSYTSLWGNDNMLKQTGIQGLRRGSGDNHPETQTACR